MAGATASEMASETATTIEERYRAVFARDAASARRARTLLPDGQSSDSRHLHPHPIYMKRAQGARKYGLDDREFLDYWAGHGALMLGHQAEPIVEAVSAQLQRGTHYGASHELEITWADLVCQLIPSADRVRFTNSGTEAVLLAIHLARMYTGRRKILRFVGHYHGWHASVNVGSGQGGDNQREHAVLREYESAVVVCATNDLDAVAGHLQRDRDIACVILEPTGPCSGVVPIESEFLRGVRELTEKHGALLIFDEIVTGFRVARGGAQALHQVIPDLTTLAKILSGGLPGGALAGQSQFMALLDKHESDGSPARQTVQQTARPIVHLGTFNGNPLSAAAGIAMLRQVSAGEVQAYASRTAELLRRALNEVIDAHGLDWAVYGEFSCVKFLIGHGLRGLRAADFDASACDPDILLARGQPHLRNQLRLAMLLAGVDISLSSFTTAAHTERDVADTAAALATAIDWLRADSLI